eukprot:scaffold1727_cov133-Cylindrotheca_fusiformis.AAC.3
MQKKKSYHFHKRTNKPTSGSGRNVLHRTLKADIRATQGSTRGCRLKWLSITECSVGSVVVSIVRLLYILEFVLEESETTGFSRRSATAHLRKSKRYNKIHLLEFFEYNMDSYEDVVFVQVLILDLSNTRGKPMECQLSGVRAPMFRMRGSNTSQRFGLRRSIHHHSMFVEKTPLTNTTIRSNNHQDSIGTLIMISTRYLSILVICLFSRTQGLLGRLQESSPNVARKSFRGNHDVNDSREYQVSSLQQDCGEGMDLLLNIRGGALPTATDTLLAQGTVLASFFQFIDIFGTGLFAFSGALKAGKKGMDLLGMTIIACITAVGGGTIRDVLMGNGGRAIFWMRNPVYLKICVGTTLATFFLWPTLEKEFGFSDSGRIMTLADALGLAAFCVMGSQRAVRQSLPPTMWIASGVITSIFGGIVRDVICGDPPRVLYPYQTIYGAGPAIGSSVYTALSQYTTFETDVVSILAFLSAFAFRMVSIKKAWRLPHWPEEVKKRKRR